MPTITITRGPTAPKLTRGELKSGMVFSYLIDGKPGKKQYAAIGTNGRQYSVNLASGEVASSNKPEREVVLTGVWEFVINRKPAPTVLRECRRSEVRSNEVFHVVGKPTLYAHVGRITRAMDGFLSVPLAKTENHAVTRNGNSRVQVIGTYVMQVMPTA